ncbi:hypothetical protein JCM8547_002765 [Rhodosporidiobolus lusitaniae]
MLIVPLRPPEDGEPPDATLEQLWDVSLALYGAGNAVVGVGAGVSTGAGIPDFRSSSSGLYASSSASGRRSPTSSLSSSSPVLPSSSLPFPPTSHAPPPPFPLALPSDLSSLGPQSLKLLFSYSSLLHPSTRAQHLRLMCAMHDQARGVRKAEQKKRRGKGKGGEGKEREEGGPTLFHALMKVLEEEKRLMRVWSQNVDGLEGAAGLEYVDFAVAGRASSCTSDGMGKGKAKEVLGQEREEEQDDSASDWEASQRSSCPPARKKRRLSPPSLSLPSTSSSSKSREELRGKVVALHGGLSEVVCSSCGWRERWKKRHSEAFREGEGVGCPRCEERAQTRERASKRTSTSPSLSFLRPAVVLYDDTSPSSHSLSSSASLLLDADLSSPSPPDFLLVAGTSLRIPGFKGLVKECARSVKRRGGLRVMVNREGVGKEWEGVFDLLFLGETDNFARHMLDHLAVLSAPPSPPSPPPLHVDLPLPTPTSPHSAEPPFRTKSKKRGRQSTPPVTGSLPTPPPSSSPELREEEEAEPPELPLGRSSAPLSLPVPPREMKKRVKDPEEKGKKEKKKRRRVTLPFAEPSASSPQAARRPISPELFAPPFSAPEAKRLKEKKKRRRATFPAPLPPPASSSPEREALPLPPPAQASSTTKNDKSKREKKRRRVTLPFPPLPPPAPASPSSPAPPPPPKPAHKRPRSSAPAPNLSLTFSSLSSSQRLSLLGPLFAPLPFLSSSSGAEPPRKRIRHELRPLSIPGFAHGGEGEEGEAMGEGLMRELRKAEKRARREERRRKKREEEREQ